MGRSLAVFVALVAVTGCAVERRPNVVLVTFDTTRADHLGCYGYEENTTPNVDRIASEGWLFTNAFATNPITLPSHTSIMTGQYPLSHRTRDNTTYLVPEESITLAEVLAEQGYETAAFVGAFVLDSQFNLDQGFAIYDDAIGDRWSIDEITAREANAFGFAERKANLVTASALEWLERPRSSPFFAWLHYFDPHQPINPPEPHHSRYINPYDAEIAFADEQVGRVFEALQRRGELDNTIIVVTADHGEGLFDHDEPTHSLLIFDSTMHVPLIIRPPTGRAMTRIDELASIVDITPTILDMLDVEIPDAVQGRSLMPAATGSTTWPDRLIYMESLVARLQCGWGELRGLRGASEKLIHGPKPRYYRVDEDPQEIFNLAEREPDRVRALSEELARRLREWSTQDSGQTTSQLNEETLAKLQALGYVRASVAASRGISDTLESVEGRDDPHAKQRLFDLFSVALENLRSGLDLQGIRQLETVIQGDPDHIAALTFLGKAYMIKAKQPERAREFFERSIAVDPYQEEARFFLGLILKSNGDVEGAREQFEAILEITPRSVNTNYELGRILRDTGATEAAIDHFRLALETDASHLASLIALGSIHGSRHEHEEAGDLFARALQLDPTNDLVLYNLGIWYLQENNTQSAITYLRRTVEANPSHGNARYVLGTLLFKSGDTDAARIELTLARRFAVDPERASQIDAMLAQLDSD